MRAVLLATAMLIAAVGRSRRSRTRRRPPVPKFAVDPTWPKDLPKGWITGQLGGVCVDGRDNVYVVNRRNITDEEKQTSISAPSIIKFNATGDVAAAWGDETTVPGSIHGCVVDSASNIYVGGNGDGIVQKYDENGKLVLQIGTRGKFDTVDGTRKGAGLNSAKNQLNMPSGIAIDPVNGDIYVSDGYGNRRVVVFDKTGAFLRQWGRQATMMRRASVRRACLPRWSIASRSATPAWSTSAIGRVIASRCSKKMARLCATSTIPNATGSLPDKRGTAWWVGFSPDREQKYLYMMNGGTEQVHVLDHASGKILSSFGRPGHQLGNFTHGHTLAVDSKGNIYVAETDWGRRIQKFKPVD